jgi:hypothetical protein
MSEVTAMRDLLRQALATLAYRGAKPLRSAPEGFASFRPAEGSRSPGEVLAHIGDLLDWAVSIVQAREVWHAATPKPWPAEIDRFFAGLAQLDQALLAATPESIPIERLIQGPIADAFTHIGQISYLRRLAGAAVRGENYSVAQVIPGRLGPDQDPPRREFD